MHGLLARQLQRYHLDISSTTIEPGAWASLLKAVSQTYQEADDYRYLMERSLELSSAEMGELHVQLAKERDTIGTVICSLSEGVCALDADGRVLFANPRAIHMLGLANREPLTGMPLDELVRAHDPEGNHLTQIMRKCRESNQVWESRLVVADDMATHLNCVVTKLSDPSNGLVMAIHDVTEQRRMEEERQELNRQLVHASRHAGMAEMATGVLHNVGNILNSINVAASILEEGLRDSRHKNLRRAVELIQTHHGDLAGFLSEDEKGKQVVPYLIQLSQYLDGLIGRMHDEANRLIRSINHAKHVVSAQQAVAKGQTLPEIVSIPEIIEQVIQMHARLMERQNIKIVQNVKPMMRVTTDQHLVLQVLTNLISNAIKALTYSDQADKQITIRASQTDAEERPGARIEIADNGIGIPEDRLLEVFKFGYTQWQGEAGSGFGLHSSANTAKLLGGGLTVMSDGPGAGARFILELPMAQVAEEAAA